jgi:hypothetical protein
MSELELYAKKQMLEYHAGHDIFCRGCQKILDARRAVELDFYKDGDLKQSGVVCATCYDSRLKDRSIPGITIEVTDGRIIFASRKKEKEEV